LIANGFFLPHHLVSPPDTVPAQPPKGAEAAGAASARTREGER
jgi:hypothetical protein